MIQSVQSARRIPTNNLAHRINRCADHLSPQRLALRARMKDL